MADTITVPLSKKKLLALCVGGVVFVCLGWWLFNLSAAEISLQRRFNDPSFVHAIGLASVILFGVATLWIFTKLFEASPGLVLNDKGLVENTNMLSIGFIAWTDISGIEVRQIQKQRLLYVILRDPEKYLATCGFLKRALLRASLKLGPSPVTITSNSLTLGFDEVVALVSDHLSKNRNA